MIYDILNFTFFSESGLFNTRDGIIIYLQTVMRFNINIENVYKFVLYYLMVPTMYKLHVCCWVFFFKNFDFGNHMIN